MDRKLKKDLHDRIMECVGERVWKVLSEEMNFQKNPDVEKLVDFINNDKEVLSVVSSSNPEEWVELFGIIKNMKNEPVKKFIGSIGDMNTLAQVFRKRAANAIAFIYNLDDDMIEDLAEKMAKAMENKSDIPLNGCGGVNRKAQGKKELNACDGKDEKERKELNDNCGRNRRARDKKGLTESVKTDGRKWMSRM